MEEMLWERFTETGRIEDYLSYAVYTEDTHDNNRRNSPERALGR
ncbi:MAG TPA: hypothetical protein PLH98_01215 [Ruminococcus flavefaciens]|nr:hypothetical protein [Ruminococcus flavefaciens]